MAGYGNEVKVFSGLEEYDKTDRPDDTMVHVENKIVSADNVRVRSRIVDRPEGHVRIREEFLEVEPKPDIENQQLNSANDL